MARIIFGALVTSIVGSIGGTTIRRSQNGSIVSNKSMGFARSKYYNNKALNKIASLNGVWRGLSLIEQTNWNNKADLYTFPDRFGIERHLTGRLLFIKAFGSLINSQDIPPLAADFSKDVKVFDLTLLTNDVTSDILLFQITSDSSSDYYFIRAEASPNQLNAPVFNGSLIWERILDGAPFSFNFFDKMKEFYPSFGIDWNFRLYVTPCNIGGYQGTTRAFDFVAE